MSITRVKPGNRFVEFSREETDQSIADRFEKQVRKNPRRIAVKGGQVQISYDDLNRSANRLAWALLRHCPDDRPIAILLQHDAPAVVAIFAALKAAKTFILLDPALPDARIAQILNDSGANWIVTNDQSLEVALDLVADGRSMINMDRCGVDFPADNLGRKVASDSIAYILYTSGSTGSPKGVIRTHRNDLHNIRNRTNSFGISDDDRITLLGSYGTGQGMTDICCALLNGATLLPRNLKTAGFHGLADWLIEEKITIYHSAATLFRHFVSELSGVSFPDLRVVRIGGEPVSWRDVELYKKHFSTNCVLANELSCSETNTVSQFLVGKQTEIHATVPVGYSVEDKEVLILDEKDEPLGPGNIGEIAVRSRFLSPGYWNRPDLTALAFTADEKFHPCLIYRTGDLGRTSADGCLEHLGRKDTRVKIRGYRVECYEIELALLQNSGVDQAFVTHRQDARDETHLVAYIVCRQGATLTVGDLRAGLNLRLPDYMVPAAFVFVDALPLTPTGKIDRRALPEPPATRPPLDVSFVEPRDAVEKTVAELCSSILGIGAIGVDDNLFDLGGNSISAMQIVAQVTKTFRIDVPLNRFYESPTIAGLSAIIATARGPMAEPEVLQTARSARNGPPPLSFSQERIWFMEQWAPGRPTYNLCQAFELRGSLNLPAMEAALNRVVERHEVLRTSFATDGERSGQVVAPVLRLSLADFDLRGLPNEERRERGVRLAHEEARRPFDLSQGPLLRLAVVRWADDEHLMAITVHQMVCDGWSLRILLSEFWQLYQAMVEARSAQLPALAVQYGDFATWQRHLMNQEWIEPQLSFWQESLGESLPILDLPADYPRPAVQSFRGSRVFFSLSVALTQALRELSRQQQATLFMTLLCAFKVLLHRHSGQNDLIVGFPVADRLWSKVGVSIGFFVNTLVVRTRPLGEMKFSEFLSQVRDGCLAAYAHQDLPFEKLVEAMRPSRELSRNPIFQALFTFQNMAVAAALPRQLRATTVAIDNGTAKVDLTLSLAESDDQLSGFLEYSADLFQRDTVERMAQRFQALLESVVDDCQQTLAALPVLTEPERNRLLVEWNDTTADYPKAATLHGLFERQAARTPRAVSLECAGQSLTYRDLNRRANQLAHFLIGLGLGPEFLVGICVQRSLEMVVGLLAVLKAGAAYVPLDPAYPRERLAFMLNDAGCAVLLTQKNLVEDGEAKIALGGPRPKVVCLDRDWPVIARQSGKNPNLATDAETLAYVIYTSGSTGTPKGVCGLHRGAVNRCAWMWRAYPFAEAEKCCIKTALSFVDSLWEVFGPLLQGVPSVLIPDDTVRDPQLFIHALAESHVTRLVLVPSLLKTLIETAPVLQDLLPELRFCCSSGEALAPELVGRFRQSMPTAVLINLYGCTEVAADATYYDTRTADLPFDVPIGRPIANTEIFILDAQMHQLPVGVPGELYVGGDGLARGYWNRPELTAQRFIRNPFRDNDAARLYRTGDRARYRPDGNIEFLGRTDSQVKIRGHRIELGEIEFTLNQHPVVKDCAVVAREGEPSANQEIIGYVVAKAPTTLSVTELRNFLKEKLPAYMVPALFVPIDALPLTPSGKIDRNALPLPDASRPGIDQGFVAPRTEIEELVAQVWREVLKLDRIGIHDNFFDLGGHSLLATRIAARLRNILSVDLLLRKIFELPTVAELAQHVEFLRRQRNGVGAPPIVPVSRQRPLPLSFSQRRLWFLQKLNPGLTAYNMPAAFKITGALSVLALEQALLAIIERHEILRTRIVEVDGQPHQEVVPKITMALPVIDLAALPRDQADSEAQRFIAADARWPYDLAQAPLMRAQLLKLGDEDHTLVLNFHHMVSDGSSLVVYYRELAALYASYLESRPSPLPSLPVQYGDYAVWQNDLLQSDASASQLDYWKRQLGSDLSPLDLPLDYDRPVLQSYRGARESVVLGEELTKNLIELSRGEGVTLFMTLLSGLCILLSRHSGQDDVVIGSTIAGRGRHETDGLIGFFINALALRMDLSGNPSFVELLKRVREVSLSAFTHQDLPFEKVVEAVNPQRDLRRNPIFDVIFNMADTSERVLNLIGCEVTKPGHSEPSAKFDIIIHAPVVDRKIELVMVYNADLFSASRITSMLDQFGFVLSQAVENPRKAIDDYLLVSPSATNVLPDPTAPLDDTWEGAIHERFAKHAGFALDRVAVVDRNGSWTCGELDRRSNQLANYLIAQGVKPKDVVAIYAHRSASLVLTLLGIVKAGAAFVILDPAYPAARVIEYLRIAQPKGWLQMDAAGELPPELAHYLDALDPYCRQKLPAGKHEIADLLRPYSETPSPIAVGAGDPAYVAFTSGSTGGPKGVLSRHGPITHFLPWQQAAFDLRESDRFCMLSGLAYSHLHRDVFTALDLGATLYIPDSPDARSSDRLAEWLRLNEITVLHLTPALGELLLTSPDSRLPSVRRIFFGGDVLSRNEVSRIRALAPEAKVGSFYGATETQRAVGYYEVPTDLRTDGAEGYRTIPLGRGIKDVQLLLLSKSGQLAGVGELGELYVRSPHLADGYIGDEARTQEMFVANPFTNDPKDRLYKTGESGRYLPDGNVEWAGRNDRCVNIRGFRVELEEVESVLKQHPVVKAAAVVLQDHEVSSPENLEPETRNPILSQCLVAYLVADEDQQTLADLLHGYLTVRLPDYMVPAHFVVLDQLPLSPNGKVNYPALQPVERYLTGATDSLELPRNDMEEKLCAIFAQVLGRERVTINENFFRIGGHSLLAAQAAARIRETFGVSLELRMFLESSTVAGLSQRVEWLRSTGQMTSPSAKDEREEFEL